MHTQALFAFTWIDSRTHLSCQLMWTVLLQGFQDSPHFFGQALAANLFTLDLHPSFLLQYVNDLLLCSPSKALLQQHTIRLLNFFAEKRYQISPGKVQLPCPQVTYLGTTLSPNSECSPLRENNLESPFLSKPANKNSSLSSALKFIFIFGFLT